MAESFQQYIKIRTFLGYRPKEILQELQDAYGDQAPNYGNVQRLSKRFRESTESPLATPMGSQIDIEHEPQAQINSNANKSESNIETRAKKTARTRPNSKLISE